MADSQGLPRNKGERAFPWPNHLHKLLASSFQLPASSFQLPAWASSLSLRAQSVAFRFAVVPREAIERRFECRVADMLGGLFQAVTGYL